MKKGFTLAEVLITLGIIGIIAAIVMPMALKIKPDKTKAMYLKAYDTITSLTKAMASNSELYPICGGGNNNASNLDYADYPLANTNTSRDTANFQNKKYCDNFAKYMGLQDNSCSDDFEDPGIDSDTIFGDNLSFTSPNGMQWTITTNRNQGEAPAINGEYTVTYHNVIYLDVNGAAEPNCFYGDACKNPDRFRFFVYANGKIEPADPMGEHYVTTRSSWTKNLNAAVENVYPTLEDTTFTTTSCSAGEGAKISYEISRQTSSGDKKYTFTYTLSEALSEDLSIQANIRYYPNTSNNSGSEWQSKSGTVRIPAGTTSAECSISLSGQLYPGIQTTVYIINNGSSTQFDLSSGISNGSITLKSSN